MIYNFNQGIGWASSGVEYAQAYRAKLFERIGVKAKFIFTDMIRLDSIEAMTKNIGFLDEQVLWVYLFFTDFHFAPCTYTLEQLEKTFGEQEHWLVRGEREVRYNFPNQDFYVRVFLTGDKHQYVQRAEYISHECMIQRDVFSYGKLFSEYFTPGKDGAVLFFRRFFKEDGTTAYEEHVHGDDSMFRIGNKIFYSKQQFMAYFVEKLQLTENDICIIDRATVIGQALLTHHGKSKLGSVIHAEHYNENYVDDRAILWNNFYEYEFTHAGKLDFMICSTDAQRMLLSEQLRKYVGAVPHIVTIPVGSLDELVHSPSDQDEKLTAGRRKHAVLTASRLATEKHIDWLVDVVVAAHEKIADISFDIYGVGGERENLEKKIRDLHASAYIHLMGHHDLRDVYKKYDAYLTASTSEGFGLTLMEAIGSGLPMLGFKVPYGNTNFVDHGENGYLIDYEKGGNLKAQEAEFVQYLVKLFTEDDIEAFRKHSYEKAEKYLTMHVEDAWKQLLTDEGWHAEGTDATATDHSAWKEILRTQGRHVCLR